VQLTCPLQQLCRCFLLLVLKGDHRAGYPNPVMHQHLCHWLPVLAHPPLLLLLLLYASRLSGNLLLLLLLLLQLSQGCSYQDGAADIPEGALLQRLQ
jgi:hypothetical protein